MSPPTHDPGMTHRLDAIMARLDALESTMHLLAQAVMDGAAPSARYDGYTSCPLVTGYGRLVLAEFDYEGKPKESFPFDQSQERYTMYVLKKYVLPEMYWAGMLKGLA
ncbi:hypothetical protein ARMA_2305 [Ardenticatena maritima]|uniref:Uncharacterized protein n=1 Tax=Ardenticatena maritima TaxID=872965 RepID=A0A0M8KA65_9CHLR|nr:hypothetical protein [Ardenticatena maritima]KPL89383.1 hypothetical protein SE16_02695 [Ardenticatena maritima]GAP63882.1 hypothetical protein ARMA_2305 [Ardenticatena maritima]